VSVMPTLNEYVEELNKAVSAGDTKRAEALIAEYAMEYLAMDTVENYEAARCDNARG